MRLPFTWKDLNMAPKNLDKDCSPITVDMLKQRLISPHVLDKYRNKPIPGNVAPMHNTKQGYCNTYIPQDSGFDRLLFVVQSFIAQGMYVVLDYQPMGLEQQAYDQAVFVESWSNLWKQVRLSTHPAAGSVTSAYPFESGFLNAHAVVEASTA